MRIRAAWLAVAVGALCPFAFAACGGGKGSNPPASTPSSGTPGSAASRTTVPVKDEIPPDRLAAVLEAHQAGLGRMEQYKYREATKDFRRVHELAPGWIPGSINLAIALLNDSGAQLEEAKKGKAAPTTTGPERNFREALALLDDVIKRAPENLHAHYCRGLILEVLDPDTIAEANREFKFVVDHDPADGHAWWKYGSTLQDPEVPNRPASLKQAKELIKIYSKALECNPYLVPALYKLQQSYIWDRDLDANKKTRALWEKLNPQSRVDAPGDLAQAYGEMGRYSLVIDPRPPSTREDTENAPRFESAAGIDAALLPGHRWSRAVDFTGKLAVFGRARARFGAAVAALDADGDGKLDLYLAGGVVGPDGPRDALLLNKGDGRFEDATLRLGLPKDRVSLGVAAGDFDADRRIDLFLTGVGDNRLYRNLGKEGFQDISKELKASGPPAISPTARWMDIDQDGDLDLYVVNYAPASAADVAFTDATPPGLPNAAYRNDGKPAPMPFAVNAWVPLATAPDDVRPTAGLSIAWTPWTGDAAKPMLGGDAPHAAVAVIDIDNDRDLDLVLAADGAMPIVAVNDRLGRFHTDEMKDLRTSAPISGLLTADLDRDGRSDLVVVPSRGRVALWLARSPRKGDARPYTLEFWPTDAHDWRSAWLTDLDLDGKFDLLGLPATAGEPVPHWARNEGNRLADRPLALGPDAPGSPVGLIQANLTGDALPDLVVVRDGDGPRLARNLGNGYHWVSLQLAGRWKLGPDGGPMRTNPHGFGARVLLQGPELFVSYHHTSPEAGPAQSVQPITLGVGKVSQIELARLRWPDGVLQCEMPFDVDQARLLAEVCRKTGSCPVLFTWNGERFVCLGDFLGGGGLGYLVAPGVYGKPDRDEAVAIAPEQLREQDGVYRLSVTEPMDEVAYLDRLQLDVVDRPPGVHAAPDERFAPGGNRPTGELWTWSKTIEPERATDLAGRDVAGALKGWDRRTVDGFRRLSNWIGYAEEHGIVLDFGDRLSGFGPKDKLALVLAGWVEYPYSQTNYAAATAGVPLRPPVLERRRADGTWETIEADPGYPAGLPRQTTLDLTGKLTGPNCVLRLRTNMECYWDQAFLAVREEHPEVRVTPLQVARAVLGARGYTREVSPDGKQPLLYDYDYVDPAPLTRMAGTLTRFGEVAPLLRGDDDQFCLVGPGDEVRLEFDAGLAPPLPSGWTRSFVLRSVGYCKDADPFTAGSDSVGPLPWKGMGAYPFGPEGERPRDPSYEAYLKGYQTRVVSP